MTMNPDQTSPAPEARPPETAQPVPELAVPTQTLMANGLTVPVPPRRPVELATIADQPLPPVKPPELARPLEAPAPTPDPRPIWPGPMGLELCWPENRQTG